MGAQIKSGSVLLFEKERVNMGPKGGAPRGATGVSLMTRRTEVEEALRSMTSKLQAGEVTREAYCQGLCRMHKFVGLLFQRRMLQGDDALIAQNWIPVLETELTDAGLEFVAYKPVLAAPAPTSVPAPAPAPAPVSAPALRPAPAPAPKQVKPLEHMVVTSKYLAVAQIKSGSMLLFEKERVNMGLKGGAPRGATGVSLMTRRTEVEEALRSMTSKLQAGEVT